MSSAVYDISHMIDKDLLKGTVRDDMTMMVAGQGGDGSLTIIALISRALLQRGYSIYRTSNIASPRHRSCRPCRIWKEEIL